MAGTSEVRIDKLGRDNWKEWVFQMRLTLNAYDAWEVVTGDQPKPVNPGSSASSGEAVAYKAEFEKWNKAEKIAGKIFASALGREALRLVVSCVTTHDMYVKLENQYAGSTALRKMSVLMEFFSLAMFESEQMVAFQSRTEGLLKDIATTGVDLNKDVVVVRVLTALPKSYNSFLSAWESLPSADQTLENLLARLINEDSRRREEPTTKAKQKANEAFASDYDFDDYSGYYARGGNKGGPRGR